MNSKPVCSNSGLGDHSRENGQAPVVSAVAQWLAPLRPANPSGLGCSWCEQFVRPTQLSQEFAALVELPATEPFGKVFRYSFTPQIGPQDRQMMESEGFVRVKGAAKILDVAPNTVRAWGAAGKITEYRHPANNYRLYKRAELESLLNTLRRPVRVAQ